MTAPGPLNEAAVRLAAIVESSDDAIVSKSLQGIVTSWNRSAERIFGYTAAEMIGQPISRIIPEDRRPPGETLRSRRAEPGPSYADLHALRVLVVDDDEDALMMVREILEASGANVITAQSATEALSLVEAVEADVLLADLSMPKMSGFELISEIRQSKRPAWRDIPAAALTAFARSEDRARALRSGFQLHVAKPIDPAELVAAVSGLSGRRRA